MLECPRCIRGTMYLALALDIAGSYWRCIQCGYHADLHPIEPMSWNPWKDRKRNMRKELSEEHISQVLSKSSSSYYG
jgi:hypothetical protein